MVQTPHLGARPAWPLGCAERVQSTRVFEAASKTSSGLSVLRRRLSSRERVNGNRVEVRVRRGQHKRLEALARLHRVVCDHLFDEGGADNGMTLVELMPPALRWWAMRHATRLLRANNLGLDNIDVRVLAESSGRPLGQVAIGIEVNAPVLSARARNGPIKAIAACRLRRILTVPPKLKVNLAALATKGPPAKQPLNPGS